MRPPKRVLIYCQDAHAVSILRVVLESKVRYSVETEMSFPAPDLFLLIGFSEPELEAFEAQRWQACRQSGVATVPARGKHPEALWMAELLERVYLASCRKRGPKPSRLHERLAA